MGRRDDLATGIALWGEGARRTFGAVYQMFVECGWASWVGAALAALVSIIGVAGAVLLAAKRAGMAVVAASVALALAAVIAVLGPVGRAASRRMIEGAVSSEGLTPTQRERLLAVGYAQAAECLPVAGINAAVPLLVGGIVLVAARGRAARPS